MLKTYYELTKPGIVYGNVFTTIAGFLFASRWQGSITLFLCTIIGIALVIASGCVFNNYIDRDIDKKMARTKQRAMVSGAISPRSALIYATILGVLGFSSLYTYVNPLTAEIALFGFIFYVVVYGAAKRTSHWGTVIGSVSGAVPIVAGYTAVTNQLDLPALTLFLILALWQMPHFYAIAIYRLDEYVAAGIPVLPAQKGIATTKRYIVAYTAAFLIAVSLLSIGGYAGYTYFVSTLFFSVIWFWSSIRGLHTTNNAQWARSFFHCSLIVLVAFSMLVSVASVLP